MSDTEQKDVNAQTVEEKLEAAVGSSDTGTVEEETEEVVEEGKTIPYKRFTEVNSAYKESKESQDLLTQQLAEQNDKLVRMAELLELKEQDVQTLNEIKSFVNDPAMADHVYAIDNKLKGIEAEVEAGETTPDQAMDRTRELLESTREEIADVQATAQAEALVARADVIADKLLAQLPEEYNEQDRNVIQDLWTDKMDWGKAVNNPDALTDILTEGLQETLTRYGTPRGSLFTGEEVEELTPEPATEPTSPEEKLAELMDQNWGGVKETDLGDGRTSVAAEKSDDEFNAAMAEIIRKAHGR
jgi:hypothetical protein